MSRDETVSFEGCVVVRGTDKALLVRIPDTDFEDVGVWIPKSQIHDDSEVFEEDGPGNEGTLVISKWLAVEKGIW